MEERNTGRPRTQLARYVQQDPGGTFQRVKNAPLSKEPHHLHLLFLRLLF